MLSPHRIHKVAASNSEAVQVGLKGPSQLEQWYDKEMRLMPRTESTIHLKE